MSQREPATVTRATMGKHEHYDVYVADIRFEDKGCGQGFTDLILDEKVTGPDFAAQICSMFGASKLEDIVGRQCFVLRPWGNGCNVEGIEVDGKRFTITDFRRKHWPEKAATRLEERQADLRRSINRAAADIQRWTSELSTCAWGYVEWSTGSLPIGAEAAKGNDP